MRTIKQSIILIGSLLPLATYAQEPSYELIAPIGTLSGKVNLTQYLNGIFETTIGIAGILAVFMLVWCGIKLMGTGSVSGKSEAKQCIWNAIFGLLLAVGSWIILNTINPLLLKNDAQITVTTPQGTLGGNTGATTAPSPTQPGCYFKYKDLASGSTNYSRYDSCAACESARTNAQSSNSTYEIESNCFEIKQGGGGTPQQSSSQPPTSSVQGSVSCSGQAQNLCEGQFRQCTNATCAQFSSMANKYANGSVSANLLKAIILQESSCGQNVYGPNTQYGQACGPTQLLVTTANKYYKDCQIDQPVTCGWLANKANWEKAVCLTSKYLNAITQTSCGTTIRNIAAGYNAGAGRCAPSSNCAGDTSCSGETVKQWECLYDDNAHKTCNSGFIETRNYATKVLYCVQHPAY